MIKGSGVFRLTIAYVAQPTTKKNYTPKISSFHIKHIITKKQQHTTHHYPSINNKETTKLDLVSIAAALIELPQSLQSLLNNRNTLEPDHGSSKIFPLDKRKIPQNQSTNPCSSQQRNPTPILSQYYPCRWQWQWQSLRFTSEQ